MYEKARQKLKQLLFIIWKEGENVTEWIAVVHDLGDGLISAHGRKDAR